MLIDTHCHLDFPDFDTDRDDVIKRAGAAGVLYLVNIGSSVEGSVRSLELARKYPQVYASAGVHPHYAAATGGRVPAPLVQLFDDDKVIAVGEVGLDYYRDLSPRDVQRSLFIEFIRLAKERSLPLVIHVRQAHEDMRSILKDEFARGSAKGVIHCFSGGDKDLETYLELGFYISFTCNLTFDSAKELRALARTIPAERLLLETDAPFMAPQKFRGKRNEPAYLPYLVSELAVALGLSEEDIARITTHNAGALFGLPLEERSKIAYPIRDSLYLNITNECSNDCDFCVRRSYDAVKGHRLSLLREPTVDEIKEAVGDPSKYREIVFCGYGEPTLRLDAVKEVARYLKDKGCNVRMVTNGEGNLIHNRSIAGELAGLIDRVSVSLNVDSSEKYDAICKSRFGPGVFDKVKRFISECKEAGMDVEVTFLDLPGVDRARCEKIACGELKARFRMRKLDIVG